MRNRVDIKTQPEHPAQGNGRFKTTLENIFVVVLAFYPLRHINWGLDLWDTGYNYANFQYMGVDHMDSMWLFSTYLANVAGNFLSRLPNGDSLMGMNLYTGLSVSLLALTGFFFCVRTLKMPSWLAFLGEFLAISLCWCPTALLYNYLTYVFLLVCLILLYHGLTKEKKWCLFGAGVCLGVNVLVRFSNLPEVVLILAVWAYDVILWQEVRRAGIQDKVEGFWVRLGRHTLWCLMGYLAALTVLLLNIHMYYGIGSYVEGIQRLFAMTDTATDYRATSMLLGMVRIYVDHFYWAARIAAILVGGMVLAILSECLKATFDRYLVRFDEDRARKLRIGGCAFMGFVALVIIGWFYFQGIWSQILSGNISVRQFGVLFPILVALFSLACCVGQRAFAVLLSLATLAWLYSNSFASLLFYSYDSMLRPGVLFLMLAMLIALVRIFHPDCSREEKLISGMVLLVVLLTSIGSNNGVYPSMNNLFLVGPYVLWESWSFIRNVGERRIWKFRISAYPAKCVLMAFLAMCFFQFFLFGAAFVFAEATGVQNAGSYVDDNLVLKGIRMSEDKARWVSELSFYVTEEGLQGKDVILYGGIPALSYYLQMPSAFNPWSDLDSYGVEQMALDLEDTARAMEQNSEYRPVIILEKDYAAYLMGGTGALEDFVLGENRIDAIAHDRKWLMLMEFMERHGYEWDFGNDKFAVFR